MNQHILIAEDEIDLQNTMRMILRAGQWDVSTASNGNEALKILQNAALDGKPVDILITDIQMPGMNGEELIDSVRKIRPDLPILVVSGFGSKDLLLRLMRRGCDDYLDKPFTATALEKAVKTLGERNIRNRAEVPGLGDRQVLIARELGAIRERYESLCLEMDSAVHACRGFTAFDPAKLKVKTVLRNKPFAQLGGDLADVTNTENGVDILVADVAGHDMGASFYTVALKTFFEEHRATPHDGAYLFELLNHLLVESGKNRMVTAAFVRINLKNYTAEVVTAAHLPVTWLPLDEKLPRPLCVTGPLLGMFETVAFETCHLPIRPGDRFFLYTDGLANCSRVDGPTGARTRLTPLGLDHLILAHRNAPLENMTDCIWNESLSFCRNRLEDDALLLAVEIPEVGTHV